MFDFVHIFLWHCLPCIIKYFFVIKVHIVLSSTLILCSFTIDSTFEYHHVHLYQMNHGATSVVFCKVLRDITVQHFFN